MEIVKTLYVKLSFFGSLGPVGSVTVNTEEASNNDFIIKFRTKFSLLQEW